MSGTRVRRLVVTVDLPGVGPARARALVDEALARVAAEAPGSWRGRIGRLRVRVDVPAYGERARADRIARMITTAVRDRAATDARAGR
ncbi:hypothetical protein [Nonomuraea endophytica]|uniref:hypothetical protein n=1 Tax=Nonomuraea endophytica TaxID=714136 RepID=UPI0037C8F841